nr:alpha-galactosidase [Clostridia bacterium]
MFKYMWRGASAVQKENTLTLSCGGMTRTYSNTAAEPCVSLCDNHGLSYPFVSVGFDNRNIQLIPMLGIYDTACTSERFDMGAWHLTVRTVDFVDRTDYHDALVNESKRSVYHRALESFSASVYIITDPIGKRSLVIVSDAPTYALSSLTVRHGIIELSGGGYGAFFAWCGIGHEEATVKAYYRAYYKGDRTGENFIMSNTWGDRSCGDKLSHEFIMREIDTASELGVDIVQIDDGWQVGATYAEETRKKDGDFTFHCVPTEFWEVDRNKFPHDIDPLGKYAIERGIRLGIWFVPDTYAASAKRGRDLDLLERYYIDRSVRYAKLDGVVIGPSDGYSLKEAEDNYVDFLDKLTFIGGGDLQFNHDITNGYRTGYFMAKQYGTLFVENRYTDTESYLPHNTLRNVWQLSRW